MVLARRKMRFSERLPKSFGNIPNNLGYHITLPLLAKNKAKHVWSSWSKVSKKLKAALVEQYQIHRSSAGHLVLRG